MLEVLISKFAQIEDPRCDWRVEHKLLDILVIAVCAVIGEAESFEDIALYGRCKRDWLQRFLELPGGIPSHDTFRRVLMLVDPEAFERCFLDWVRSGPMPARPGRSRSTARRCGARSTVATAARLCTWSARSQSSPGWCWRSARRMPSGAS
jgi:DDE family transposase